VKCIGSDRKLEVVRKEKSGGTSGEGLLIASLVAKYQVIRVESI